MSDKLTSQSDHSFHAHCYCDAAQGENWFSRLSSIVGSTFSQINFLCPLRELFEWRSVSLSLICLLSHIQRYRSRAFHAPNCLESHR